MFFGIVPSFFVCFKNFFPIFMAVPKKIVGIWITWDSMIKQMKRHLFLNPDFDPMKGLLILILENKYGDIVVSWKKRIVKSCGNSVYWQWMQQNKFFPAISFLKQVLIWNRLRFAIGTDTLIFPSFSKQAYRMHSCHEQYGLLARLLECKKNQKQVFVIKSNEWKL